MKPFTPPVVVLAALTALGCSADTLSSGATNPNATTGGTPAAAAGGGTSSLAGAAGALPGAGGTFGGGAPGSGGNVGGTPATGGASMGSGGAAGGASPGGAGGAIGVGGSGATGGVAGVAGAAGAASYPHLSLFGNTTTLELAPVLVAAMSLYPGMATVKNGGIPNLWSSGADAATNAETQALVQSVTHPNLRIVFTVCEGLYRIVARRSAGIAALGDLRGKKIATVPSTSSAYYLHRMLAAVQLTESDVTVVAAAAPSSMPGSLMRHDVDAVTIWEPEIQNAADALGSDAIQFQDTSVYRELFNLNTTAEELADPTARRGIVELLRSLVKASAQITSQPSSVFPLVASTTGFDAALVAKAWPYERFAGTLVPDLLDVLEAEEAWLAKNGARAPRDRSTLATLVDDSPLKEALASP